MNNDPFLLSVIDLLLKSTAILTVAFTVQHFWRKASAATLSMVWLMAFGALLLLPLTRLSRPLWTTSFAEKKAVRVQALPMALPAVPEVEVAEEVKAIPAPVILPLPSTKQVLLGVWLIGTGLLMMRTLVGGWQLRRIKKKSLSLNEAPVGQITRGVAQTWGVRRPVELCESKEVPVPLTWGTMRPVLMLPHGADRWKREQLLAALQHELGHIKRHDVLTRGLMDLACALYWMNPLVWFAAKAMRLTQERACDDLVLNAGVSAEGYATQLLESARAAQAGFNHRLPALAMAQPSTLETRLLAIVDEQQNRSPISGLTRFIASSAAIAVLLLSATMQLRADGPSPADDSSKPIQQIHISVKVIEATSGTLKSVLQGLDPGKTMSQDQAATFIQSIAKTPKTDMISSPSVTTRSGQQATVSTGRDYVWRGNEKEMTFIGTSVSVLPTVTDKGEIKLKTDALTRKLVSEETKPVFQEFRVSSEMMLQSGQTVILSGAPSGEADREQLFVISAQLLDASGLAVTTVAPKEKTRVQALAEKIIIPSMAFHEASLEEAVDFLRIRSREINAEKKGINFVIQAPKEALSAKVTLSLKDIPLSEALNYITQLTNMTVVYEESACIIRPMGTSATAVQTSTASTAVATKAETIIIPHLEFAEATISEAIEFLSVMSRKHDPEKKGVNLILNRSKAWDEPGGAEPVISMSLNDVPLSEALKYVAELSNLKLSAQADAYMLSPIEKTAKPTADAAAPMGLKADSVTTNNGLLQATGNVTVTFGKLTINATHWEADSQKKIGTAKGKVEVIQESDSEQSTIIMDEGQVEVNLQNGAITTRGKSKVIVKDK